MWLHGRQGRLHDPCQSVVRAVPHTGVCVFWAGRLQALLRRPACQPQPKVPPCLCPWTAPQRMLLFHRSLCCIGWTCSAPLGEASLVPCALCLVRCVMLVVTMACIVRCLSPLPPSVVSAGTCARHVHPQQAPLQHWHHWARGPWQDHSDGSSDQGLCMHLPPSVTHPGLAILFSSWLAAASAPLISRSAALARTPFTHTDVHCLCWGRGSGTLRSS